MKPDRRPSLHSTRGRQITLTFKRRVAQDGLASEGRICPLPQEWNELWQNFFKNGLENWGRWEPPQPLILPAWHHTVSLNLLLNQN